MLAPADNPRYVVVTTIEDGGFGASPEQLFDLLIELGEADSNLPQSLRAHFGFVERLFGEIFGDYQRELRRANAFDFDDLPEEPAAAVEGDLSRSDGGEVGGPDAGDEEARPRPSPRGPLQILRQEG